jgi:hypothetical protein
MTKLEQKLKDQLAKLNAQIDSISADEGLLKREEEKLESVKRSEQQAYRQVSIQAARVARGALSEIDPGLGQNMRPERVNASGKK